MKVWLIAVQLLWLPYTVFAHGPTPQKAKQSEVINASVDQVWALIKDFDRVADWHPAISESSGDGGNETGSIRKIVLLNGGELEESLDYYSATEHEYNYRLKTENLNAFPVSFYTVSLQVVAEGDKARVNWKSRFYRGDTGNFPSEKMNDVSAVKAMNDFIVKGLSGLQAKFN